MNMTEPTTEKATAHLGIYLPKELKQRIEEAAKKDRRKTSPWVCLILEEHLKKTNG